LTIVQQDEEQKTEEEKEASSAIKVEEVQQAAKPDVGDTAAQAEQIIANAWAQLDVLAAGVIAPQQQQRLSEVGGLLLLVAPQLQLKMYPAERVTTNKKEPCNINIPGVVSCDAGGNGSGVDNGAKH
jgi:hypothetical protein